MLYPEYALPHSSKYPPKIIGRYCFCATAAETHTKNEKKQAITKRYRHGSGWLDTVNLQTCDYRTRNIKDARKLSYWPVLSDTVAALG
jgi:hypothetical protein